MAPICNIWGNKSFLLQPIIVTNDFFQLADDGNADVGDAEADVDDGGGDDDVDDVNQKTKQEQVEVQLRPFWGIRQYQI